MRSAIILLAVLGIFMTGCTGVLGCGGDVEPQRVEVKSGSYESAVPRRAPDSTAKFALLRGGEKTAFVDRDAKRVVIRYKRDGKSIEEVWRTP